MSLMTLVRLIGALALGWTLVALGIGASGTRLPGHDPAETLVRESPPVDAMPRNWPIGDRLDLIDRTNGRPAPIRLPEEHRWSLVTVSPWRTPGGALEAVGRWTNPGNGDFCGWGLFRLSDGAILGRVATEVLPAGRPCWVPGDARTILFTAADGRLYRCRLTPGEEQPVSPRLTTYASGRAEPSDRLVWETRPPGSGEVFLDDPVWPDVPRWRKWVFVALRRQEPRHGHLAYRPSRLWWLELSEDAGTIVAAGPLTATVEEDTSPVGVGERFPNVAISPSGAIRLVYLERWHQDRGWRLRSGPLEIDARTGRPSVVIGEDVADPWTDTDLQAAPLLVSADGARVYGLLQSGGLAAFPAAGRSQGSVDREGSK